MEIVVPGEEGGEGKIYFKVASIRLAGKLGNRRLSEKRHQRLLLGFWYEQLSSHFTEMKRSLEEVEFWEGGGRE